MAVVKRTDGHQSKSILRDFAKNRGIFPSRQSPEVGVVQGIYTMLPRGILFIHVFLGHIAVLRFGNFIANDLTEWCNLSFA